MPENDLVIGGACGYWGEASHATAQLLSNADVDYLIYDYLAEITLSIMARARLKDSQSGYATDFVTDALTPNLQAIAGKGVKVISNAGGMNPDACAHAVRTALAEAGLSLRVAVVKGDDLLQSLDELATVREMFSGEPFPPAEKVVSANAYLGAYPIAAALNAGADIVITGRCVDSALTLAACIHEFGWQPEQLNLLAAGSLVGHLIECGPQLTGGNFTDWQQVHDYYNIGYPLARVTASGECVLSKPDNTTGLVSQLTAAEQMLYETADPTAYVLPDVTADFSQVRFTQLSENEVLVNGARGRPAPVKLKASITWQDGYRAGYLFTYNGTDATSKAKQFAQIGLERARRKLKAAGVDDYCDTSIEVWGGTPVSRTTGALVDESHDPQSSGLSSTAFNPAVNNPDNTYQEVLLKTAVRHADAKAVGLFLKETMGAGLSAPPGLAGFTGAGRPRPSPVVRLFSCLIDRSLTNIQLTVDGKQVPYSPEVAVESHLSECFQHQQQQHYKQQNQQHYQQHYQQPPACDQSESLVSVPLQTIAVARSGDKGDTANIGIIAREPALLPWIWQAIDEPCIKACFADLLQGPVHRYYLPGCHAMNIVLEQSLGGGGVASLRNDAQGKGYAQTLLSVSVFVPVGLLDRLSSDNS